MPRLASLFAVIALSGCTLNVSSFERPVTGEHPAPFSRLDADLGATFAVDGELTIRGTDRSGALATAFVNGVTSTGVDPDEVARALVITFPDVSSGTIGLTARYSGPDTETVWIDRASVELPRATSLELDATTNLSIEGIEGPIHVLSTAGTLLVRGAGEVDLRALGGSIDVEARSGDVHTGSGSLRLAMSEGVVASAGGGLIDGVVGGGGSIDADSGSIRLSLAGPLTRDLSLTAASGAIELTVPHGVAANLDLRSESAAIDVEASSLVVLSRVIPPGGGETLLGTLGGGGDFTIHATVAGGAIRIVELP